MRLLTLLPLIGFTSCLTPETPTATSGRSFPVVNIRAVGPATTTAGASILITLSATDQYGNPNGAFRGTIRTDSTDLNTSTVLPPDYTFVADDNGTKQFIVILTKAGTQTVTFTDLTNTAFSSSIAVVVSGLPATDLAITGLPVPVIVGQPFSVTVSAVDVYGNRDETFTGDVELSSTDATATYGGVPFPATHTYIAGDRGRYTFADIELSATAKTLGFASELTAATLLAGLTADTETLSVLPGPLDHFEVSGMTDFAATPDTVGLCHPTTMTVEAFDAQNNLKWDYAGTVELTATAGTWTLPDRYTFTPNETTGGTYTYSAGSVLLTALGAPSRFTVTDVETATNLVVTPVIGVMNDEAYTIETQAASDVVNLDLAVAPNPENLNFVVKNRCGTGVTAAATVDWAADVTADSGSVVTGGGGVATVALPRPAFPHKITVTATLQTAPSAGGTESDAYVVHYNKGTWAALADPADMAILEGSRNRIGATIVWTGASFLVWGGYSVDYSTGQKTFYSDGAFYTPGIVGWTDMTATGGPTQGRYGHTAIVGGTKLFIFGGTDDNVYFNDGWVYDWGVTPNTWTQMSFANVPSARAFHTAVWDDTGGSERMIIWGGRDGLGVLNSGALFNPATNAGQGTWTSITASLGDATPAGRSHHAAFWDSATQQMVIWGGWNGSAYVNDTATYKQAGYGGATNPHWTQIDTSADAPAGRAFYASTTVNGALYLWGGVDNNENYYRDGGKLVVTGDGTVDWDKYSPGLTTPSHRAYGTLVYHEGTTRLHYFGGVGPSVKSSCSPTAATCACTTANPCASLGDLAFATVAAPEAWSLNAFLAGLNSIGLATRYHASGAVGGALAGAPIFFWSGRTGTVPADDSGFTFVPAP